VLDLCTYKPMNDLLDELIGEPMGVSLNLTGVVSTERNWHQDDYLNPALVSGWYAAAWFAVGDIDPDSGPFQYVPGSHRWPVLRRDRVLRFLSPEERASSQWPRYTERFLDQVLGEEIVRRGAKVETLLGEKGDVLIWHARLVHRGSLPKVPGTVRRSFIAHYTGRDHWGGGDTLAIAPGGGRYFVADIPLDE
jgi:ectoine hydroxylase-related dioxygenase (phytanoyl-CoA dioxygenase family)